MIITISGTPGSGKSTVAKILVQKLGWERIYVGGIRRDLAKQKGMTLKELNEYALTHPETDIDVDKAAAKNALELEKKGKNVLVEGRTQFYFLPKSFKIYLTVNLEVGAERVWQDLQSEEVKKQRNEDVVNSLEEMKQSLQKRMKNDTERYMKYYGFDCYDQKHYDLVINTSEISAEEAAEKIIKETKKLINNPSSKQEHEN